MGGAANKMAIVQTSDKKYKLISALAAFLLWGSWAFYVNRDGVAGGFVAGFVQGTASFLITLFMIRSIHWFARNKTIAKSNRLARTGLPAIFTLMITGSFLVIVHKLAQTQHIVSTIAPALSVALGFALYTSFRIIKNGDKR